MIVKIAAYRKARPDVAARYGLGGAILFDYSCRTQAYDNNIESPEQVRRLCAEVARLPSYSADIAEVKANALLASEVARAQRLGLCLKHFPGIGGARVDAHQPNMSSRACATEPCPVRPSNNRSHGWPGERRL